MNPILTPSGKPITRIRKFSDPRPPASYATSFSDIIFTNRTYFLTLKDLPSDQDHMDRRYYRLDGFGDPSEIRPWAFLGEVTDNGITGIPFMPNLILAKDVNGNRDIPVSFDVHDSQVSKDLKVGHTLCFRYPRQHRFPNGKFGLLIEQVNPFVHQMDRLQIYPCKLDNLMLMSKAVKEHLFSKETHCWNCRHSDESTVKKLRCAQCQKATYCNTDCQKSHWLAGESGHKKFCKLYPLYLQMLSKFSCELRRNHMLVRCAPQSEEEEEGCVSDAYVLEQMLTRGMNNLQVSDDTVEVDCEAEPPGEVGAERTHRRRKRNRKTKNASQ